MQCMLSEVYINCSEEIPFNLTRRIRKSFKWPLTWLSVRIFQKGVTIAIVIPSFEHQSTNTLATWCKEPIHLKRPWCWERLRAEGEGDDKGWDVWMASLTLWTWVWINSGSWWWTGRPGVLRFMGSQRVRHDWVTELSWSTNQSDKLLIYMIKHNHHNSSTR